MPSAFLKTHARGKVISDLSPDEIVSRLQSFDYIVVDVDSEHPSFTYDDDDYTVKGHLERWEGTGTRLHYDGKITIKPFDPTPRIWISIILALLIIIGSVAFLGPLSVQIFGTEGFFTFYNSHIFIVLLFAITIVAPLVYIINRDPNSERRWNAQQRLGAMTQSIEQLKIKQ